jgi:malate dehydrogenase (oxaloacetate-decarboxylating)(NADP+)
MEGKGLLFKTFADVDVFDIEIAEKDPDKLVEHCKSHCTHIWRNKS